MEISMGIPRGTPTNVTDAPVQAPVHAHHHNRRDRKLVEQIVDTKEIVLHLPEDVAATLMSLMQNIYGNPSRTYRIHTRQIGNALWDAGVRVNLSRFNVSGIEAKPLPR